MYSAQKFKRDLLFDGRIAVTDVTNAVSRLCLCAPLSTRRFVQTRGKVSTFLQFPVHVHSFLRSRIISSHSLKHSLIRVASITTKVNEKEKTTSQLRIRRSAGKMMYRRWAKKEFQKNCLAKRNLVSLNTFVVVNLWNVAVRVALRPIRQKSSAILTKRRYSPTRSRSLRSLDRSFKRGDVWNG